MAVEKEKLASPSGDVILTVTGDITNTNVDDSAQFDLEMLMALDDTVIETSTIWTQGIQTFQGVSLDVLTETLGITEGTILATAINNYTIEIPTSDAKPDGPIIAYMHNGETMTVRNNGPLWIIYPYDSNNEYRSELIYSRSIWQLDRIKITQ